jgi:hypothetical protein
MIINPLSLRYLWAGWGTTEFMDSATTPKQWLAMREKSNRVSVGVSTKTVGKGELAWMKGTIPGMVAACHSVIGRFEQSGMRSGVRS